MQSGKSYFPHIDGLRTVAVIGVLLAHFHIPGFPGGFLGVDVFFVISGFLITRLIIQERARNGRFSYSRFYVRRIRRLMPAALAVVAISLVIFIPILSDRDLTSFLRSVPSAIFSFANINYFLEVGYFDRDAQFKPLLHTWSLAVEEQFYLIWPTVLLVLMRWHRWLLPLSLVLLAGSLAMATVLQPLYPSAVYYLLPFRAFELLIGAVLAAMMAQGSPNYRDIQSLPESSRKLLAVAGVAMILVSYVIIDEHSPLPGPLSLLPGIGTALVIAYGDIGWVGRFLTWRPVVWIGLISYSLYLVHWPLYVYLAYRLPEMPSMGLRLALLPISIMLAALSYYLIEQPFRHPAPKDKRWGNAPFLGATLALASVLVVPTLLYKLSRSSDHASIVAADEKAPSPGSVAFSTFWYQTNKGKYQLDRWDSDAPNAPRVLVLGDSHALQLREGVEEILAPRGFDIDMAKVTGCPPLFDVTIQRETDKAPDRTCAAANAPMKELALHGNYDVVILASRWGLAVGETEFPERKLRHIDYVTIGEKHPTLTMERTRKLFDDAMTQTVSQIRATGKRVILMGQVPPMGTDLTQCQALFPWTGNDISPSARCSQLPVAQVESHLSYSNARLAEQARTPGVLTILSPDLMCSDTSCLSKTPQTGEMLYMDDNHLSTEGSVFYLRQIVSKTNFLAFIRGG